MSKIETNTIDTISGSTDLQLGSTNATIIKANNKILFNNSGDGIYLGVTSATASNLLDDYEEGTWTPSITSGFASFTVQNASYTKIGRTVNIQLYGNNVTTKNSDQVVLDGLPFTSGTQVFSTGSVETSSGKIGIIRVTANTTEIKLYYPNVSTGVRENLTGTLIGQHIICSFTYQTDA